MDIIDKLAENNVEARPIWKPMHTQPYYSEFEFFTSKKDGELSIGEDIFNVFAFPAIQNDNRRARLCK